MSCEVKELGRFRVGDVFPADDGNRMVFLRYLVASQALVSAARVVMMLNPEDHPADEQAHTYAMLWSVGASREACKAFSEADEGRFFRVIEENQRFHARMSDLSLARQESDWSNTESLVRKYLKRMRDTAGFHWDLASLQAAARQLASDTPPAWRAVGLRTSDTSVPIAWLAAGGALLAPLLGERSDGRALEEIGAALLVRIVKLQGALFRIGEVAFWDLLRECGICADSFELDDLEE